MYSLNINAAVAVLIRALILHLYLIVSSGAVENIENRVSRAEHILGRREYDPVGRDKFLRAERGIEIIVIIKDSIAANADSDRLAVRRYVVDMRQIILVHRLNLGAVYQYGYQQDYAENRDYILFHVPRLLSLFFVIPRSAGDARKALPSCHSRNVSL